MKIIAIVEKSTYGGETKYIAEISSTEIAKVMNKVGNNQDTEFRELKVGADFALAVGYDYISDIRRATSSMQSAYETFNKAAGTMTSFAAMLAKNADSPEA